MNRTVKALVTILFMCLILGSIFFIKKTINVSSFQKIIDSFDDIVVQSSGSPNVNYRSISYTANLLKCPITYEISKVKDKYIYARLRYLKGCSLPFKLQRKTHLRILKRASNDWEIKNINSISTPSIHTINPDYSWNKEIMDAAKLNDEYLDFKKNYPNHKSRKSSNAILIELINERNVFEPYTNMLSELGIIFKLTHSEKVFQMNRVSAKKLRYELDGHKTLIYDAGNFTFSRFAKTKE